MTVNELLTLARRELGNNESPPGSNNIKYNTWYYGREVEGSEYPWCMAFVQWLFYTLGNPLPLKTASCSALLSYYKTWQPKNVKTEPEPGDIAIYTFGHTGIVETVNGDSFTAIEGNTAVGNDFGEVMRRSRTKKQVSSFIRWDFEEEKMDFNEFYKLFKESMEKYRGELSEKKCSAWAEKEAAEAALHGITDGTRPMDFATREDVMVMAERAVKALDK